MTAPARPWGAAGAIAAVLLMAGCASDPLPEAFTGPKASLSDLVVPTGGNSVDIFYAAALDGKAIRNSRGATASASAGLGPLIQSTTVRRDIPAQGAVVTIVGVRHYAAPILEMFNPAYRISGNVAFTPEPDGRYRVRGSLLPTALRLWIEDLQTGKPVTETLIQECDWEAAAASRSCVRDFARQP